MKKKALYGFLILVALALAAPFAAAYWYGREAESALQTLATDLGQRVGARVTVKRYERGALRSRAEIELALQGTPATVTTTHDIVHGPLGLDRWLEGEIDLDVFRARVRSELTGLRVPGQSVNLAFPRPPVVADTVVKSDGTLESRLRLASSKEMAPGQRTVDWAAGSGTLIASADLKRYEVEATLPSLRVAGEAPMPGPLEITNLRLGSQMAEGAQGVSFGTTTVDLARVALGEQTHVAGLSIKATTRPSGPHLELVTDYRIGEVQAGGQKVGPGQVTLQVRKLDLASLARFSKEVKEIYARNLPEQQSSLMVVGKLLALATSLAEGSPELEVTRLSLKTANGEITGKASMVLDGSHSDVRTNPMRLLTALRGEAELNIPGRLLRPLVAPLVQQDLAGYRARGALSDGEMAALRGEALMRVVDRAMPLYLARHELGRWLQPDGDRYRIKAAIRRGQFLVNDRLWTAQTAHLP